MSVPEPVGKPSYIYLSDFLYDEAAELVHTIYEDHVDNTGKAVFETPFINLLIHAEVMLPHGEELHSSKVKGQTKDLNENLIRIYNQNPLLASMLYDVDFPDGAFKQYSANVFANNM